MKHTLEMDFLSVDGAVTYVDSTTSLRVVTPRDFFDLESIPSEIEVTIEPTDAVFLKALVRLHEGAAVAARNAVSMQDECLEIPSA